MRLRKAKDKTLRIKNMKEEVAKVMIGKLLEELMHEKDKEEQARDNSGAPRAQ